jgi:GntR family transcriptional regulator
MFITVDAADRRPIYQQVVDEIKALIARGELRAGVTLPTVRQLAANLGVNMNTIATAYHQLQDEGLISVRHGSGAVVTSNTMKKRDDDELKRRVRTTLTELVLAGLQRQQILALIDEELAGLTHLTQGAEGK